MSDLIELNTPNADLQGGDQLLDGGQVHDLEHRFGFNIGRYNFVLAKTMTTEILLKPTIYRIPNSPGWVFGMVNLRSNILPVIDLSQTLGTRYVNNPGDFVLVIDKGKESVAILIDALPKLLINPLAAQKLGEANYSMSNFIQPGVYVKGDIWDQLDVKGLVSGLKDRNKS